MTAVATQQATRATHKLWGGRFSDGSAPAFDALNNSIGTDFRLWPYDIRASKAWAMALYGAGVLTLNECTEIENGLDAVERRLMAGELPQASDEDVHTMIDRMLHEEAENVAAKLHTGRSRNDQVATATRLWSIDATVRVEELVRQFQRAILTQASPLENVVMPSYTHLQRAIPVSASHWLLAHFWPLERDRARLRAARAGAAVLPLGSGAVAGSAYPISRVLLQGSLGFASISPNSIDAVSDRDFVAEILFTCTLIATHLSRFAEDLIVYGSSEFGFVKFGERFTSGSSMMPQKRNPDALEIARGSSARLLGDLTALLALLKGLPSSYNKDLQDDKRVLFDAIDTISLVLPAFAGALAECQFQPERMEAALSSSMMATDLADYLVRRGATFREAHSSVGKLVKLSEDRRCELADLSVSDFSAAHALFGADTRDALSPRISVTNREVPGGTGPRAVADQLRQASAAVAI
jgi:argininosuccinate lyase